MPPRAERLRNFCRAHIAAKMHRNMSIKKFIYSLLEELIMKCENCGKNEVSFVYRSSINGKTEEHHLCQACAEKLGYTQKLFARRPSMVDSFFGNDDFFGDFFSPMPSLLGRMNRMLENPFDDFFDTMPALSAAPAECAEAGAEEGRPWGELRAGRAAAGRDPQAGGGSQGSQRVQKGQPGKRVTRSPNYRHPRIKEVLNDE